VQQQTLVVVYVVVVVVVVVKKKAREEENKGKDKEKRNRAPLLSRWMRRTPLFIYVKINQTRSVIILVAARQEEIFFLWNLIP
jgi:hypothetical protein